MIYPRQFGEWMPDAPDLLNGGLVTAKGCYPSSGGYAPFWSGEILSLLVSGTILGAARFEETDGTEVICVGTSSDLFVMKDGAVTSSSLSLSGMDTEENWTFEQFGLEIYATLKSGASYYLTNVDTDTSFTAAPGTPPSGAAMSRIDDFLVYGNLKDIDATDAPYRVRWSQFNNASGTWGTDLATQSGFKDMPGQNGVVTGIAGGSVGLIMQKKATSRMDYVGGALAFTLVKLEGQEDQSAGCVGQASIASVGGVHYWLSDIGFVKSAGGGAIQVISAGKVWDFFLKTVNTEKLHKVQAAVNRDRRCIIWNCYQTDLTAYNFQMIYNWELNRWSYAFENYDWLVPHVYTGSFGENDPRLRYIIGGFDAGAFHEFSGTPIEAVWETGEEQIEPGRRVFVQGVRPLIESESATTQIAIKHRSTQGGAKVTTTPSVVGSLGYLGVNVDARYVSVQIKQPAGSSWDKAYGMEIEAIPAGVA